MCSLLPDHGAVGVRRHVEPAEHKIQGQSWSDLYAKGAMAGAGARRETHTSRRSWTWWDGHEWNMLASRCSAGASAGRGGVYLVDPRVQTSQLGRDSRSSDPCFFAKFISCGLPLAARFLHPPNPPPSHRPHTHRSHSEAEPAHGAMRAAYRFDRKCHHAPPAVDARWRAKAAATLLAADAHAQWRGVLAR